MDENLNNGQKNNNQSNDNLDVNSQINNDLNYASNQQSGLNNQLNEVEQSPEENPYYNPYFQNNNSPYMDNTNSGSSLNTDIYNQSYINMYSSGSNSSETTDVSNTSMPENSQANNSVNLFDMDNNQSLSNETTVDNISTQNDALAQDDVSTQSNFAQNDMAMQNNNSAQDDMATQNSFAQDGMATQNSFVQDNMATQSNNFAQDDMAMQSNNFAQDGIPTPENTSMHINPILNTNFNNSEADNQSNFNINGNIEVDNQPIENNQFNSNPNAQSAFGNNNDEEFKKSWMGSLYDKANSRKFSIPAFFFGGLYYLYRKLYLFGFIFIIVTCLVNTLGIYFTFNNITNPSSIILSILLITILPIILGVVYGFSFYPLYKGNVNKNLEKYKNEVQNPNQLLDTAKQKGGTSIPLVLVGILINGIICSVALTTVMASAMSNIMEGLGILEPQSHNNLANNTIETETVYDIYNFYNDYYFEYDTSKWSENEDKKLSYNNYTLTYIQSIEDLASAGFNSTQSDGRASFFTYLYNLFSSQIDSTNTTLELGTSSFVNDNGIYYSYIDLVYATSIERCYFVIIPQFDIFIEFILSNNDTVISEEVHNEVVSYICSIDVESVTDTSSGTMDENANNTINNNTINTPSNSNNNITSQGNIVSSTNTTFPSSNSTSQIPATTNRVESNEGGLTIVSNTTSSNMNTVQ